MKRIADPIVPVLNAVPGSAFENTLTIMIPSIDANNPREAKRSGWRSAGLSIVSMGIVGLLIALFSNEISRFLVDDDEVVRLTVIFVWFLGSMQPLMAIEFAI